jgi:hypothetical protein
MYQAEDHPVEREFVNHYERYSLVIGCLRALISASSEKYVGPQWFLLAA